MNTTGVVCPGCMAGDFAQPHICGGMWTTPPTNAPIFPQFTPTPTACEHCWCSKDASTYRRTTMGEYVHNLEPHQVCCSCGSRRITVESSE